MAIEKYIDSITSEHIDKPNFIAWLSSSLSIVDGVYNLLADMDSNFDIDNAIGVQLDMLGTIIGRSRILNFQPLNGYDPVLNDADYKLVLRAKIAMNNWDGTIPQIYEIWDNIFDDIKLQLADNQDMSFTAYILGYVNQARQSLIQAGYIVPKPEGVAITYVGKSPVHFGVYSGMIVSTAAFVTINMRYTSIETVKFGLYSAIGINGISKTTINQK
ncbi:DUF2612 domain-containing protein (plasmid) [Clostridium estertheticum]|uniref:DUF2612 domain-containing protein n=1 Tax=Clostridium estertheticum TaxID=238834 RepID=UPI001C7D988F|nr:DUF2612 domain-containing protein [Clostridium estertheticum]MBX4259725.1 DUF2612 domain-containing protein [Clostridium estertheticum]WLC73312.1 DUF2612 domain-containing protein [Clostridium estertheticum]